MRLCELKQKEVINICSCRSMGYPIDFEIDPCKGLFLAIILPGPGKLCGFFHDKEYVVPWNCIKQIGVDIILVEIDEEKCLGGRG